MSESPIIDPSTGAPMDMSGAKMVVGDDELRARQAATEIRTILDAYDAELFPTMVLSPKGIIGVSVDVLPKSRLQGQPSGIRGTTAPALADEVQPDQAAGDDGAAVEDNAADQDGNTAETPDEASDDAEKAE
jgi:hypothetical protein